MKKIFLPFVCLALAVNLSGQTISQKEATELLKKSFNYLKNSDTASFVDLWYLDNTTNPPDKSAFDRQQLVQAFRELQQFLVVPVFKAKYKIKAYFKIDDKLTLGYGFLLDYINGRWAFRWHGETTIRPT